LRDEYTRTIQPASALAAETLTLERTLSDLVNQAFLDTDPPGQFVSFRFFGTLHLRTV
jgi:hypothetical protein